MIFGMRNRLINLKFIFLNVVKHLLGITNINSFESIKKSSPKIFDLNIKHFIIKAEKISSSVFMGDKKCYL